MANVIYKYPQSSCNCHNCTKQKYESPVGVPTNMSVRGCDFSPYYDCYSRRHIGTDIEPKHKTGYEYINPDAIGKSYAKDFQKIDCPDNNGCNVSYASTDPRLISVAHGGQVLTLDRPPVDDSIKLSQINTDPTLNYYGQNYKTYSDINTGQISYYVDKSREEPFYSPLFVTPAYATAEVFKDPMGAIKPEYNRTPINLDSPLNTKDRKYVCGSSWIQDTTDHREDLLALQMRKHNQERWMPRWESFGN